MYVHILIAHIVYTIHMQLAEKKIIACGKQTFIMYKGNVCWNVFTSPFCQFGLLVVLDSASTQYFPEPSCI
jgi:hypothetical protein